MEDKKLDISQDLHVHPWLKSMNLAFVPGPISPVLESVMDGLRSEFRRLGHNVQATPDEDTDVIITSAAYGESLGWRKALIFNIRRLYGLEHTPTFYTLVQISPEEFNNQIDHLNQAIAKDAPDESDFTYDGLAPEAPGILYEQGKRGGALLAFQRLIQAQVKSIRVLLVVADEKPQSIYHFDLVGAHPKSSGENLYRDVVLRITTTMSTEEVKEHQVVGESIPAEQWNNLSTPGEMIRAGQQIGERDFFTDMVRIADVVKVPAVSDVIADQYSEGCFATWDPELGALIATVTGSARPVHKGALTEEDLAVIVGVRRDGKGALVRHVAGKRNDPPSTEAVELIEMDDPLPWIQLSNDWPVQARVPVVRSKLHGHRGVKAYNPDFVEYVPLEAPFYHYPVSCATYAQAQGIRGAFARSECLNNPQDPRRLAFTVLPGHGAVIAEKWIPGNDPFQTMWEYMDAGYLVIDNMVPQGEMSYKLNEGGRMVLVPAEN